VNGRAVHASCVAAQAQAHGLDAKAALDECIAFELLAQEAEARGLRGDVEVGEAWRRELVREVITADLGVLETFDDLPPAFLKSIDFEKQKTYLRRPEIRVAQYVRCAFPKQKRIPEGAPLDLEMRALCDAVWAEVEPQGILLPAELFAIADRVTTARGLPALERPKDPYPVPPADSGVQGAVPPFRDALYALPEIGAVHPPVRTKFGWDIILWHDVIPAADLTQEIFTADVRKYFVPWSDGIARQLGVTYDIDDELLGTLVEDAPE
jgi:hypothetical protein